MIEVLNRFNTHFIKHAFLAFFKLGIVYRHISLKQISNKFRLLCQQEVEIKENEKQRQIFLPLIPEKEMIEI